MSFERILITGAGGMLGNAIHPYFKERFPNVMATDKVVSETWITQLDIRDDERVRAVFAEFEPDLVLNLAAETDLEYCELHADVAKAVNADATARVAQYAEAYGATLVYISTAGVFDGKKEDGLYTEQDVPNPIMVYGQTKFDGEVHVANLCSRHYIIRAGWMVGGGPAKDHKFVSKILEQIGEGRSRIHAVADKWGTPTYTHDFAMTLFRLLDTQQYGTYHMVCEGTGSRFDVAKEIVRICERDDIEVVPVDSEFFRDEYPAPRPRSEMLINANLNELGINSMRGWKEALEDYIHTDYASWCASTPRLRRPA